MLCVDPGLQLCSQAFALHVSGVLVCDMLSQQAFIERSAQRHAGRREPARLATGEFLDIGEERSKTVEIAGLEGVSSGRDIPPRRDAEQTEALHPVGHVLGASPWLSAPLPSS